MEDTYYPPHEYSWNSDNGYESVPVHGYIVALTFIFFGVLGLLYYILTC